VLVYKRLERGRFQLPRIPSDASSVMLDADSLAMLLGGVDLKSVRRIAAWSPKSAA
jgi:transposase